MLHSPPVGGGDELEALAGLREIFSHFTLSSLFDVLLVAAVIYGGLRLIRGTRALQLAAGLAVYAGIYALSGAMGLSTLHWLLGQLFLPGVLILVILFQPELRLALEKLGRGWIRAPVPFSRRVTLPRVVTEVVKACAEMSERKVGALIAIQRETDLDEVIATGVRLEARVSSHLLISIFQSQSPLHDGAVVIRGGRIVAAGCLLPLSDRPYFGTAHTRHLAGLGLSETTDAVVVIVSEETGAISLCYEGRMVRNLSPEELRQRLFSLLGGQRELRLSFPKR